MVEVDYLYHPHVPQRPADYASGGQPGESHWAEVQDVRVNGVSISLEDLFFLEGKERIPVIEYLAYYVAEQHSANDGW